MRSTTDSTSRALLLATLVLLLTPASDAQELGARWGTAEREREAYRVVRVPIPEEVVLEAGAILDLDDGRMAIGTRRGDVWFVDGVEGEKPEPTFHRFATGLDEVFGLAERDGALYVTQSCELTRVTDTDGDDEADRFETISDAWGYENYHEYAFGSEFDPEGNLYVALGLSLSYHSRALYRGWVLQVTPEGDTIPLASGLRSPAGIGPDEHGQLFVIESQGPWNSSCSLKVLRPGAFLGHPASYNWYEFDDQHEAPATPESGGRLIAESARIPELDPYAVIFPYIRMGRSISGFVVDDTEGAFGPFGGQLFLGDYTLSLVMRATTEEVEGVWQGACYPFLEGLSTGLLDVRFTPGGSLLCGGTNRGWPVRGIEPYALERIDWNGAVPFEIERITVEPDGFSVRFTRAVDPETARRTEAYALGTFTHRYHAAYGGPEVDQTEPEVVGVEVTEDGLTARLHVEGLTLGHVVEFDLGGVRSAAGEELVHTDAYYTLNALPAGSERPATAPPGVPSAAMRQSGAPDAQESGSTDRSHPVPEDPRWLTYEGGDEGVGAGQHVVFIAADQEYRSEQSMPMLARLFAERHGFHTTVLFALNEDGLVDPTLPTRTRDNPVVHTVPGTEYLAGADALVLMTRFITLPEAGFGHLIEYLDSGKPLITLRTSNHGFLDLDYRVDGERVRFGDDVLGGAFRGHHGRWKQDSTRATVVFENAGHPVLRGVEDVWGPSDVYRTYPVDGSLPEGCVALLMGQPLTGRQPDDPPNEDLIPLPVAWVKTWTGAQGETSRVFHTTMGSARDLESEDLRRLVLNATLWGLEREAAISPELDLRLVGEYAPLDSGFNYEKLGVVPRPPSYFR